MRYLRQGTAIDIAIGPFLDSTDGVTPETALSIGQADVRLKKNAGAWAQKNQASSATHEEGGWYECSLDATDTATAGVLMLSVQKAGAAPVWHEFMIVSGDGWFLPMLGTGTQPVNATLIEGSDATTQIQTSAAAALTAYDPPTKAELDAAVAPLATIAGYIDTEIAAILVAIGDLPTANENADALLGRNVAGGSSSGRLVKDALRRLRNRVRIAAGTATVYEEDDTTPAWTAAVTTSAGNPVSEVNPT